MYKADGARYDKMPYNRCGKSGLKLPALSLGMWHNFGSVNDLENMKTVGDVMRFIKEQGIDA